MNSRYYVCNYGEGGNFRNKPIYVEGPACSKCPKGTICRDGLCSKEGNGISGGDEEETTTDSSGGEDEETTTENNDDQQPNQTECITQCIINQCIKPKM